MADIDYTPTMTSNTAPSPYVTSASTEFSVAYEAWTAFDQAAGYWATSTGLTTGWLKLDLGAAGVAAVNKYKIKVPSNRAPKDFTLQGSNNDSDWDVLDTRTNETGWGADEERTYTFTNSTAYRYYKLVVTANDGGNLLAITEMTYLRTPAPAGKPMFFSGGVAVG